MKLCYYISFVAIIQPDLGKANTMDNIIDVDTGDVKCGVANSKLRSVAIGSCIAIAAYNLNKKTCALAHVMLPGKAPEKSVTKTKYAEDAINKLIEFVNGSASNVRDIEVCLVGAGNVLEKEDDTICGANINSVTKILKKKRIPVRASSLGGIVRRSIVMDVDSPCVCFSEGGGAEQILWEPDIK
jgi:chemotaxis receptor (MCP) glutamine deamidase CheD